eukprot:353620-Chlamydomonas_euryale.AAC.4
MLLTVHDLVELQVWIRGPIPAAAYSAEGACDAHWFGQKGSTLRLPQDLFPRAQKHPKVASGLLPSRAGVPRGPLLQHQLLGNQGAVAGKGADGARAQPSGDRARPTFHALRVSSSFRTRSMLLFARVPFFYVHARHTAVVMGRGKECGICRVFAAGAVEGPPQARLHATLWRRRLPEDAVAAAEGEPEEAGACGWSRKCAKHEQCWGAGLTW